jgi:hypothetical protein
MLRIALCITANSDCQCPFWVKSGHQVMSGDVRFTPKADIEQRIQDVRFVPKADSCTAAINASLRRALLQSALMPASS